MPQQFAKIMFTDAIQKLQERHGSRRQYQRMAESGPSNDRLTAVEAEFIQERDSFYMASAGENGWPYIQHRGGPRGFLKIVDPQTLAFADFGGNKQYVSTGNLTSNDKVTVFLMDYPHQARLKILGHAEILDAAQDPELARKVELPGYIANMERVFRIHVAAFDWNCPQHITRRFSEDEVQQALQPLLKQIGDLKAENTRLRQQAKI